MENLKLLAASHTAGASESGHQGFRAFSVFFAVVGHMEEIVTACFRACLMKSVKVFSLILAVSSGLALMPFARGQSSLASFLTRGSHRHLPCIVTMAVESISALS